MIKNYNKSSIVIASNCREDNSVFRLVKNLIKKKTFIWKSKKF